MGSVWRRYRIKSHHTHCTWIQFTQHIILADVFFYDSVAAIPNVIKCIFYIFCTGYRQDTDTLAHPLAVWLIYNLAGSFRQLFQYILRHIGSLHTFSSIKFIKYFGKYIFIHQHTDITSVCKFLTKFHTGPECRYRLLLFLCQIIESGPCIFAKRNVIVFLSLYNILLYFRCIQSMLFGIFSGI